MKASVCIRTARIRARGSYSPDSVEKLGIYTISQDGGGAFGFTTPVLFFEENLLTINGFLAGRVISDLRRKGIASYFIYGSHVNQNGKRHHVLVEKVPEKLILENWEIVEWIGNNLMEI